MALSSKRAPFTGGQKSTKNVAESHEMWLVTKCGSPQRSPFFVLNRASKSVHNCVTLAHTIAQQTLFSAPK